MSNQPKEHKENCEEGKIIITKNGGFFAPCTCLKEPPKEKEVKSPQKKFIDNQMNIILDNANLSSKILFKPKEEWGKITSPERNELRKLLENYSNNSSNRNSHEQAVIDFISSFLTQAEEQARKELVLKWENSIGNTRKLIDEAVAEERKKILETVKKYLLIKLGEKQGLEKVLSIIKGLK